jgi:hypothetical protein
LVVDQAWSAPTPIPVIAPSGVPSGSIPGSVTIPPNTHYAFIALVLQSTAQPALLLSHYEVRITLSSNAGIIVNCYAIDATSKIIEGNTALNHELAQV